LKRTFRRTEVPTPNWHKFNLALLLPIFILASIISSCGSRNNSIRETPTSGNIKIAVDESFAPIVETTIETFTTLYPYAYITPDLKYEPDVINDLLRDSVKVIVTGKRLTQEQTQFLNDSLIFPETTPYARDAIAFIVNKNNPDTLLRYEEIYGIFKGSFSRWSDIGLSNHPGSIRVILDNPRSGNIRYLKEKFNITDTLPNYFFALNSHSEVIDFVAANSDALGIISYAYISDKDNRKQLDLLSKIKVVAISAPNSQEKRYFGPSQGTLYEESYPFCREILFISRETFTGLGSGFIQFATGEQGQRIVLKAGLLPSKMPERNVRVSN
jgi:phosphate transport system substrate-binding protein